MTDDAEPREKTGRTTPRLFHSMFFTGTLDSREVLSPRVLVERGEGES